MNEYIPNGYTNWTEYNRAMARQEKRKYWLGGVFGAIMLIAAFVADGYINTITMGM